jgi:very-short-patch-repair endonuclease
MSTEKPRAIDDRISRARELRRNATDVEKLLWQHLRQPPFKEHHFRRQATIGPYFCDFASHKLKLVIELDGGQHADNPADARRTAELESKGYRVLRFWNNEVIENLEGVLSVLLTATEQASPPTPDASPPPGSASLRRAGEGREAPRCRCVVRTPLPPARGARGGEGLGVGGDACSAAVRSTESRRAHLFPCAPNTLDESPWRVATAAHAPYKRALSPDPAFRRDRMPR